MSSTPTHHKNIPANEPTWNIVQLFPNQGHWSETEYLDLNTNHYIEFSQGILEILSMPSQRHQFTVAYLYRELFSFLISNNLGEVVFAPLKVKLWEGKFREPDILFMLKEHEYKRSESFWQGADLVMEVVSPDDPKRDTEVKRFEYAKAGISEYWLVNPINETITVFTLPQSNNVYKIHGVFDKYQTASSVLLTGFQIEVGKVYKYP